MPMAMVNTLELALVQKNTQITKRNGANLMASAQGLHTLVKWARPCGCHEIRRWLHQRLYREGDQKNGVGRENGKDTYKTATPCCHTATCWPAQGHLLGSEMSLRVRKIVTGHCSAKQNMTVLQK